MIATLRDAGRWLVNPYGLLDERLQREGLTFRLRLPILGDVLVTGERALIAQIAQHPELDAGSAVTPALAAILGTRSLIMLAGEAHAARHRLIAPLFRGAALTAYDELTARITRAELERLPRGPEFAMAVVLRRIGLQVIVAAMFGDGAVAAEAAEYVERFLDSFRNPLFLFARPLQVNFGRWSPWGRALANRRDLCDFIRREIRVRRERPGGSAILGRLMAAAGDALTDDDIIEEVLSLLLFGHDTPAATAAWAFAHIYSNANIVERLREETTGAPDSEFLRACLQESMRLCPVVVHLTRCATADVTLGAHTIQRGKKVLPCTYLAQHDAATFPDPYTFRPERFLNGQRYEDAYFPFGIGRRTCVGMPLALRQMQLTIAETLRTADLELAPGYVPTPARQLVLIVPRAGTPMRKR